MDKTNFRAQGGEGAIHIIGDLVCKVCDDGKMIPEQKIAELTVLDHPRIIRPEDVLLDNRGKAVGYTMKLVPNNAVPLAQILTKAYRERENVSPAAIAELVKQAAETLRFIHQHKGYLQVDGNEFNYMVTSDHRGIYFIDVNSFQTPSYPADAIMSSVRDWTVVPNTSGDWPWSEFSDAWSFAIISFYMFTAIHPFKGRHPDFPNVKTFMVDQMKAHKSVLDPDTSYPAAAVYSPFDDVIPGGRDGAYMQWYRAEFCEGKRLPIPSSFQAAIKFIAKIREIIGSDNFVMELIHQYDAPVIGYFSQGGNEAIVTRKSIYTDSTIHSRPAERFRIGFTPMNNIPVALWLDGGNAKLLNLRTKAEIPIQCKAREIMASEGRLYVLADREILEVGFLETSSGQLFSAPKPVANVMPTATELHQGVAIQDVFGTRFISIFPERKIHRQYTLAELSKYRVTAAKYENGVLMIVGANQEGEYDRLVYRFTADWRSCEFFYKVENINPTGLNFTVNDRGVCICLNESEKIEVFSRHVGADEVKSITDPAVKADMHLCHSGSQIRFALADKLYSFKMK